MRPPLSFSLLVLVSLALAPSPADACSCSVQPRPLASPDFPSYSAAAFPTNGLFTSSLEWRDDAGTLLVLERDTLLSDALGYEVRRPRTPVVPGSTFHPTSGCPASGTCRHALVFAGAADVTPPSAATLVSLGVRYASGAPATGATCQTDDMVLEVGGSDAETPRGELVVVVFAGATEAEALAAEPALGAADDDAAAEDTITATLVLGTSAGHTRDGGRLPESGTYCVAVALMDQAGNVGPRSEAVCVDTTDPDDPAVELVPYAPGCSGAFCSVSHGRTRLAVVWLVPLLYVVLRRRGGASWCGRVVRSHDRHE
jgi:hypothetical protein